MWRQGPDGKDLCNSCGVKFKRRKILQEPDDGNMCRLGKCVNALIHTDSTVHCKEARVREEEEEDSNPREVTNRVDEDSAGIENMESKEPKGGTLEPQQESKKDLTKKEDPLKADTEADILIPQRPIIRIPKTISTGKPVPNTSSEKIRLLREILVRISRESVCMGVNDRCVWLIPFCGKKLRILLARPGGASCVYP